MLDCLATPRTLIPLDVPVLALGQSKRLAGQRGTGRCDRIQGVGLPDPPALLPVRPVDLDNLDAFRL